MFIQKVFLRLVVYRYIFQNDSPQNFRDLLTCRSYPWRWGFNSVSSLPLPSRSPGLVLHVIPGSLKAQKSVDAFDHSDIAVPPIMEEVRDSWHVFISSSSDEGSAVLEAVFTDGNGRG